MTSLLELWWWFFKMLHFSWRNSDGRISGATLWNSSGIMFLIYQKEIQSDSTRFMLICFLHTHYSTSPSSVIVPKALPGCAGQHSVYFDVSYKLLILQLALLYYIDKFYYNLAMYVFSSFALRYRMCLYFEVLRSSELYLRPENLILFNPCSTYSVRYDCWDLVKHICLVIICSSAYGSVAHSASCRAPRHLLAVPLLNCRHLCCLHSFYRSYYLLSTAVTIPTSFSVDYLQVSTPRTDSVFRHRSSQCSAHCLIHLTENTPTRTVWGELKTTGDLLRKLLKTIKHYGFFFFFFSGAASGRVQVGVRERFYSRGR